MHRAMISSTGRTNELAPYLFMNPRATPVEEMPECVACMVCGGVIDCHQFHGRRF